MIELLTSETPNGWKISIALEEMGLPYTVRHIALSKGEQKEDWHVKLNPNGRIPTIVDHDNGDFAVFESGAILIYLAEKTGKLIPADAAGRWHTIQWVFFQMAAVGPMFGQVGFFHRFAGKDYEDKRPLERYRNESRRLLGVMEKQLEGRDWIAGDQYTIADISLVGWVRNLVGFYGARELVEFDSLKAVPAWLDRVLARPAVQRGLEIPARPA